MPRIPRGPPIVDELMELTGMHPFLLRKLGDILLEVRQCCRRGRPRREPTCRSAAAPGGAWPAALRDQLAAAATAAARLLPETI